jgi:sterol desaturase/sphingolipid hydroxylase (fatty acid hydroxylase superfamily)
VNQAEANTLSVQTIGRRRGIAETHGNIEMSNREICSVSQLTLPPQFFHFSCRHQNAILLWNLTCYGVSSLMGTVEAFLGTELFNILFSPVVFFFLLFLGRAIFFTTLESIRPAHVVTYRAVVMKDLAASLAYAYLIFPFAAKLSMMVPGHHSFPAGVGELPLPLRVVLYFILADFGHYWIHRLTHTRYFWQVHKWHHSPTYMYWLGGVRATLPQQFLVNIPYVIASPLLDISPWWMALAIGMISTIQNDWMHMNVTWQSNWLEWIFVTPRYHHIHHSTDPQHYMANMANLFSVWDRLFGTYVNPERVRTELSFGITTRENPIRLVSGI